MSEGEATPASVAPDGFRGVPERAPRLWAETLLGAVILFAVLLICFSPPWNIFWAWARVPEIGQTVEVRRGVALLQQLEHPLAPVQDPIHRILQWRLLFPGIAHGLRLPGVGLLAQPYVGAVLALWTLLYVARREGVGRAAAAGIACVLGATGWFFASTGWLGYFDSWLVTALLLTSFARNGAVVWSMCVLAPWVDERFIIALPVTLVTRCLWAEASTKDGRASGVAVNRGLLLGALGLSAAFVVVRLSLGAGGESMGFVEYIRKQQTFHIGVGRHLLGLAAGLRFGWIFLGLAVWLAWRAAPRRVAVAFVGGLIATVIVAAMIANDLSRSSVVLAPVALAGAIAAVRGALVPTQAIVALAVVSLLVPAWHVVTDFSLPIPHLPAVVQAFRHPQGTLDPLNWVKTAERFVAEGNVAVAERHLDAALRLDPRCGAAYNVRGFIAYQRADWKTAFDNFAAACRLSPTEPSYWLHYAYAAWKLGDRAIYRSAIAEAKRLAPASSDVSAKIAALESLAAAP